MILLYGALASLLTSLIKYLGKKVGKEDAGAYVLVAVFILCLGAGVLEYYADLSKWAWWEIFIGGAGISIGFFEAITKNVWKLVKR